MRILLISTSFNSFSQRIYVDLVDAGYEVSIELSFSHEAMHEAVALFEPDVIICPFLKEPVPEGIWRNHLTLIMHPGIKGDRGPTSIDWAILENRSFWGVTALEAAAEMDAGAVWSTHNFKLPFATKSYVYRTHIVEEGVHCVFAFLDKLASLRTLAAAGTERAIPGTISGAKGSIAIARRSFPAKTAPLLPEPLNAGDPKLEGRLRPLMKQADRKIDWWRDSSEVIVRKIHASDGFPGVRDQICNQDYLLFGAHFEDRLGRDSIASPGDIIATRYGAICRKTVDGAIWISHLKRRADGAKFFKLPAAAVLPGDVLAGVPDSPLPVLFAGEYRTFKEIWYKEKNGAGFLFFEFHNGAMSTEQCKRLTAAVLDARRRPVKVLVLMGGVNFWSNGIHLNIIEAASDPALESWNNINAIDDLVLAILRSQDQLTIAAIGANAGAGGVMLALAADRVIVRNGAVLNPHYKSMGLYGSEYWTYSLPKRVGMEKAIELTENCLPINAKIAAEIGMIDALIDCDADQFEATVTASAEVLAKSEDYPSLLAMKRIQRARDEARKPLSLYRHEELSEMRLNFWGTDDSYHLARHDFVHKISCGNTPLRLAKHRQEEGGARIICGRQQQALSHH